MEDTPAALSEGHEVFFPTRKHFVLTNQDFVLSGASADLKQFHAILDSSDDLCSPFYFNSFNALLPYHEFIFSKGAIDVLTTPNAGGNSENSEALSFEILHRVFGAQLLKTEMAIRYPPEWKKTDYLALFGTHRIGVSVTRAMKHIHPDDFLPTDAEALLSKKLSGVNISSEGVDPRDSWERQLLHIFAQSDAIARTLYETFTAMSSELRSNTIVICTIAPDDRWIF